MVTDIAELSKSSFKDLAFKVLSVFVFVSVFDPIIFELLHEHFSEEARPLVYRLFNMLHCTFPVIILWAIWHYDGSWGILTKNGLSKIIVWIILWLVAITVLIFSFSHDSSYFFGLAGFYLFSLGMMKHYTRNIRYRSWDKKSMLRYQQYSLVFLILTMVVASGNTSTKFSVSDYDLSFAQADSLNESRSCRKELACAQDSVLANLAINEMDSLSDSVSRAYDKKFVRVEQMIRYQRNVTLDAFKPLFEGIRYNELVICLVSVTLLIWLLAYSRFKGGDLGEIRKSTKTIAWVYVLMLINLMQPINVDHIPAEKSGFMYYIGNWYAPSTVSHVTTNIYNSNTTNNKGDIHNYGDSELRLEIQRLVAEYIHNKEDSINVNFNIGPLIFERQTTHDNAKVFLDSGFIERVLHRNDYLLLKDTTYSRLQLMLDIDSGTRALTEIWTSEIKEIIKEGLKTNEAKALFPSKEDIDTLKENVDALKLLEKDLKKLIKRIDKSDHTQG